MKILFLILLLFILALPELWTFLRVINIDPEKIIYPFPFLPKMPISISSWIWAACLKMMPLIFALILWIYLAKYRTEINIFSILTIGYLADYFLYYNSNFGYYKLIPLSYTTAMLFGFFLLIIFNVTKLFWNGRF